METTEDKKEVYKPENSLDVVEQLEDFIEQVLAIKPNKNVIKTNAFANNSKYIPIGVIEAAMDMIFSGLWKTRMIGQPQININSIVVNLEVDYFHPVAKAWLTRCGTAAIPIQVDPVTKLPKDKSMQKAVPAAKAEAFKNAVKSLGVRLGRDLNRDDSVDVQRIYTENKTLN